jgi:hypothetical protein
VHQTHHTVSREDLFAWVGFIMYIPPEAAAAAAVRSAFQEFKLLILPLLDKYDTHLEHAAASYLLVLFSTNIFPDKSTRTWIVLHHAALPGTAQESIGRKLKSMTSITFGSGIASLNIPTHRNHTIISQPPHHLATTSALHRWLILLR